MTTHSRKVGTRHFGDSWPASAKAQACCNATCWMEVLWFNVSSDIDIHKLKHTYWLVVEPTNLKNISQIETFPQIFGVNIKNDLKPQTRT